MIRRLPGPEGSVDDYKIKPIAEEIVPINTITINKIRIDLLLLPLDFIPSEDDSPSGKLEMKITTMRTRSTRSPYR